MLSDFFDQEGGRFVDTALEGDRIGASGDVAHTLFNDGVGQHGGGGGTVASGVVGFGSGLTNQGNASVLDVVFEFNFLSNGDAIVDDLGGAKLLLENHVAALGAEGNGNGLSQNIHAPFEGATGVFVVDNALSHRINVLRKEDKG